MARDRHDVERILGQAMTVGTLRDLLEAYDDDCPVVFTCDYGDYGHTTQALTVSEVDEHPETDFDTTGYSHSGIALKSRRDDDEQDCPHCADGVIDEDGKCHECGKTAEEPSGDRPEPKTVVVLS